MNLRSTAPYLGESIDCRHLQLVCEFYELSKDEAISLVQETTQWLQNIFRTEYIAVWRCNGHQASEKKVLEKGQTVLSSGMTFNWSVEAFVCSEVIYNSLSLKKYTSYMQRYVSSAMVPLGISKDFGVYWESLFPNGRCDNSELHRQIVRLFQEGNRCCNSIHGFPDAQGSLWVTPHSHNQDLFYGSFSVSISKFCLGDWLRQTATQFSDFLQCLNNTYCHLNGRVMLQPLSLPPGNSPYMNYFGQHCLDDGSYQIANQSQGEWNRTYYLRGVEWMNVISPRARIHLPTLIADSEKKDGVYCRELNNGSILLKSKKPVDLYDVGDARVLKKLVASGLYPGGSQFLLRRLFPVDLSKKTLLEYPRCDWSVVPVFENEICLVGSILVFRSESRNV